MFKNLKSRVKKGYEKAQTDVLVSIVNESNFTEKLDKIGNEELAESLKGAMLEIGSHGLAKRKTFVGKCIFLTDLKERLNDSE